MSHWQRCHNDPLGLGPRGNDGCLVRPRLRFWPYAWQTWSCTSIEPPAYGKPARFVSRFGATPQAAYALWLAEWMRGRY